MLLLRNAAMLVPLLFAVACGPDSFSPPPVPSSDDDDAVAEGPVELFDAHFHLKPGDSAGELLALAQKQGLRGLTILGPRDASALASAQPSYVVPFAFPNPNLPAEDLAASLLPALQDGARGIGELSIRHFPAGLLPDGVELDAASPEILAIFELAASEAVPVNVHLDYQAGGMAGFETALDHRPEVTVIWAHAGDAAPEAIRPLLEAHPNLWADLSCRNPFYLPRSDFTEEEMSLAEEDRETLREDWRQLLEDFSDRFVFGSDVGPLGRDELLHEVVPWYQDMLGQLSPEAAEAIGHRNAEQLFGL